MYKKQSKRLMKLRAIFSKDKIDKSLVKLGGKKTTQVNKIRNKRGKKITDTTEIHRLIRDYYEQLYANKLENLEEMDNLLESYNLARLSQEEITSWDRPIMSKEIESVII